MKPSVINNTGRITAILVITLVAPALVGETAVWRVLLEDDYETAMVGARLWQNIGNSGPAGAAFAGVSERTASGFDGGWQSYEFRLGRGEAMRERYYWMYLPLPDKSAADALSLRFDLMSDAGIADTGMSFALMGGKTGGGMATAFIVGTRDGQLIFGPHGGTQPLARVEPHVWYRIELNVSGLSQPGEVSGTLRLRDAGEREEVFDVSVSVPEHALPLRNFKVDRGRSRWRERGESTTSLFIDNLLLRVR